jgi:predicted regulator of Ras-like GTPase activity (Roadblock/LC7/MglB family)
MTIPFIDLFRKLSERFSGPRADTTAGTEAAPPPAARPRVGRTTKATHPSLSKTVLPNRTRSLAPPDPFRAAAGVSQSANPSLQLTPGKIVSGTNPQVPRARELPRALALALEPKLERAVSLRISDFIDQVPAGFIKPVEILDVNALVSLKASEIEKGMAEGKPSVSLVSLYQQVPEIFLRSVPIEDETRVALPYDKVYAQFKTARVREDQESDPDIPQVDTPILQVTLEETKRFGTKMEPLKSSALPPVPVEPATAQTIAKAEPEPVARETSKRSPAISSPHPVISLQSLNWSPEPEQLKPVAQVPDDQKTSEALPEQPKPLTKEVRSPIEIPSKFPIKPPTNPPPSASEPSSEPSKTEAEASSPRKIPFQFPPNGTGGPASERVPASTGPPVPINVSVSPTPIPLKSPPAKVSDTSSAIPFAPTADMPAPVKLVTESSTKPETAPAPAPVPSTPTPAATAPTKLPAIESLLKPKTAPAPAPVPSTPTSAAPAPIKLPAIESLLKPKTAPAPALVPPTPAPAVPAPIKLPAVESLLKPAAPTAVVETARATSSVGGPSLKVATTPESPVKPAAVEKPTTPADFSKVSLPLKSVLQNLPSFQLNGDPGSVPEDVRVAFSLSVVEPQLVKGRVAIAPEDFRAAIPEAYRNLFQPDVAKTPVLLPLQEVLKNLPDGVLRVRPDQEEVAPEEEIETPFSVKAKEDARHFVMPPAVVPASVTKPEPKVEIKPAEQIETPKPASVELEEVPQIDVKEVMTRAGAFAGVKACAITFSDGLNLAGTLPPQMRMDGLCAMAPSLLQKVDKHMGDTKLGNLVAVTVHAEAQAVSFFAKGNICLAVLHGEEALSAAARGEIADLVKKLSRTYTHPETSHVDH